MSHFAGRHGGPRSPWGQGMVHGNALPLGEFFARLDVDGNGKITKEEVLNLYAKVDRDGDGSVTRRDFIKELISSARAKSAPDKATPPDAAKDARSRQDNRHPGIGGGRGPFGGGGPHRPGFAGPPGASMFMDRFDKEHKGKLTKEDLPSPVWDRISKSDTDGDGSVTKEELEAYFKNRRSGGHDRRSRSRPDEKRDEDKRKSDEDKPKDQKPEQAQPQAQVTEADKPADATSAVNVAVPGETTRT